MAEEKNSPQPGLSDLEITDEIVEFEVMKVPIKARMISGEDYADVMDQASSGQELNRTLYGRLLIGICIVEPKGMDPKKLKPAAWALIVSGLEDALGFSEVARKKFEQR